MKKFSTDIVCIKTIVWKNIFWPILKKEIFLHKVVFPLLLYIDTLVILTRHILNKLLSNGTIRPSFINFVLVFCYDFLLTIPRYNLLKSDSLFKYGSIQDKNG